MHQHEDVLSLTPAEAEERVKMRIEILEEAKKHELTFDDTSKIVEEEKSITINKLDNIHAWADTQDGPQKEKYLFDLFKKAAHFLMIEKLESHDEINEMISLILIGYLELSWNMKQCYKERDYFLVNL